MLPRIKINYLNGQLGTVAPSEDGLFLLVCPGVATGSLALDKGYSVRSVADFEVLGASRENNPYACVLVENFYKEASEGTELIVMLVEGQSFGDVGDKVYSVLEEYGGRIRGVFSALEDNEADLTDSETYAKEAAEKLYAPVFFVLNFAAGTVDFSKATNNHTAVLLGYLEDEDEGACTAVGLLAGRLASIPVHRNIGRVKDGALAATSMYLLPDDISLTITAVEAAHAKGYIVPRTYTGLSGYYFADDCMACDPTDDYAHLTARRTIDKAYRIAYQTLVQFMLDEIEVNEDGTMQNGVLKSWQQAVENAINRQMTAKGELSATDGEGCVCFIDPKQNVLATSRIELTLKVRPYGYARFIDVNLGFQVID